VNKLLNELLKDDVSYDEIALALFKLPEDGIDAVLELVLMHSGIDRLNRTTEAVETVLIKYDLLRKWRDDAGEVT